MNTQTTDQKTAILKVRIRRQPASLANYHYHIEPGKRVYVFNTYGEFATVATMPEAQCCSEDYFRVRLSSLDFQS